MEAADSRAADSEATVDDSAEDVESSEELADDAADEAAEFIIAPRQRDVEGPNDYDSSPEYDDPALIDAAPSSSSPAAPEQPKRKFADEDDLLS